MTYTPFGFDSSLTAKKRVFLSFVEEDKMQVQGLRLLKDNPDFALEFYDESVRVPIERSNTDYVKRVIREKIARCSVTVCLIGATTYQSKWVNWELRTSEEEKNRIIVMALKGIESAVLPQFVRDRNLTFHPWDPAQLATLI